LFLISSIDLGIYFSSKGEESSYFLLFIFEFSLDLSGDIEIKSSLSINKFISLIFLEIGVDSFEIFNYLS
jgi:hypothetical protein